MTEHILVGIVSVIVLGIGTQWLAWRFRVPSILLLLLVGFVAGPVTGFLSPESLQGDWVFAFVSLSIGIILFEGGLNLRLGELREVGVAVRNLISIGVLVTWVLAGLGAYYIVGLNLSLSILIGAILTVTGPTVVIPLLRHVRASGRVGTMAKWEGITIDPVGAILAVLVLETILLIHGVEAESLGEAMLHALEGLFLVFFISVGISITAAAVLILLLRRRLIPDYLQNAVALMVVVGTFALSNVLQEESGLLEVTLLGIIMANQKYVPVRRISEFKENLQVLLIGCLFIVLSARLELGVLDYFDGQAFLFLAVLILAVRPLAVMASAWGTNLNWKEQAFMAWLAPRGIVAAAVASLFAFRVEAIFPQQVGALVPLVFLVIVGTVAVYGLTIGPLARYLGLAEPDAQGVLFVGAHTWARRIAKAVADLGYKVLLVDSNAKNIEQARREELPAEVANALTESALDELNLSGIGRLLAVTPNEEVNALAALNFAEVFESNDIFQLTARSDQNTGKSSHDIELPRHLRGRPLFGAKTSYQTLSALFNAGGEIRTIELDESTTLETVQSHYDDGAVPLFLHRADKLIVCAEESESPQPGDTLVAFVPSLQRPAAQSDAATFEHLITHAFVLDFEHPTTYAEVVKEAAALLALRTPVLADELMAEFLREDKATPITRGAALPHCRLPYIDQPELVLVRCRAGVTLLDDGIEPASPVYALFFLVSPEDNPRRHLRILANIASRIDDAEQFVAEWRAARNEQQLKETLLHHERFLALDIQPDTPTAAFIDQPIGALDLPPGNFVALLHRGEEITVPHQDTTLQADDRITIIGDPAGIHRLFGQYRPPQPVEDEEDEESEGMGERENGQV